MGYSRPEPLRGKHLTDGFECGDDLLDDWLCRYARLAEASNSAKVFVTTTDGDRVAGYYALAASQVEPRKATRRLMQGQARNRAIPTATLARLAVDREHQGREVGRSLLMDALLRCATVSESMGLAAVTVDAASDQARAFYERFGFEASPTDPRHLILLMKDLRKLLDSHEPAKGPDDSPTGSLSPSSLSRINAASGA